MNETVELVASETVWRDYYNGERLASWEKPYKYSDRKDGKYGEQHNCMVFDGDLPWTNCWNEWLCDYGKACMCHYQQQPILHLRGLCKNSFISKSSELKTFTFKQMPSDPDNMILLGQYSTRIMYDSVTGKWKLKEDTFEVTAESIATRVSYALGKHTWTIANDSIYCNNGEPYTKDLKLTGCKEEGEFTCNDGQCVKMEERCNQVPDCRDKSDEKGCQMLILEDGYNKNIPPIERADDGGVVPAAVSISMTLMKVVAIDETDHSIHLQFEMRMRWKENRAKYQNLKNDISLNALIKDEVSALWLPLIIYLNTDQKESTRLGTVWEWSTKVIVTKEGGFKRSGVEEVDEAEVFEGAENDLTMVQAYTHEFQWQYQLNSYPFDTQVTKPLITFFLSFSLKGQNN